ncbi:hypothetical protein, variant [Exophiala sideris]|uniref:alpha-1,3-glucan synthase n=1 Tax=Exophiala sideris TaxID=1016849 RepID=A0A0D1Z1Z7_9EURO|nr:hypothetical protein PV11_03439 [Exophiala sideris]KIV87924.1 hypothetical protein, variant [Exophiala sideris]
MLRGCYTAVLLCTIGVVWALRYEQDQAQWNLNQQVNATRPVEYWGEWANHTFHPSPDNWRMPFYSVNLDRFVDGDPTNDDANGTQFEHNWMSNQFRFGGDARGLMQNLDYLHGMGIKGLYLTGSPFINLPWGGDGYGPLDFTLLDHHHGTIEDWRALVSAIHERNMYVLLDNTLATMGDLIGFEGYLNATAPFSWNEYNYEWKSSRQYHDFSPNNSVIDTCVYPHFWGQDGYPIEQEMSQGQHPCYDSDFDQYGDMPGVGAVPVWQSQLAKFASTQDRLRIWRDDVLERLQVTSCMQIAMLDIDGFRMDKALQTPLESQVKWADYQRACARRYGKTNFLIVGEAVGDPPLAAVYMGRGKQPDMYFENITEAQLASNLSSTQNASAYLRESGSSALDGAAFHYPVYGALTRFLGLSGLIGSEGEDWTYHWETLLERDDMVNAETGLFDPRHMFGTTNQDIFRWPALSHGLERQLLGFLVTQMLIPGIPLLLWGEEQAFYTLENLADDYVFGRMPMASQRAWQLHGCYQLSEDGYYDQPFNSSRTACHDDSVSLDHRDPSHPVRNLLKRMYQLREEYTVLNDGYTLRNLTNLTHEAYLPGSSNIPTEFGVWSVYRGRTEGVQDFADVGEHGNQGVWFVYMNENKTTTYDFNCTDYLRALGSPFATGTQVKNLFYPYDEYTLQPSRFTFEIEGSTDYNGCLPQLEFVPWGFKAFVPIQQWKEPMPTVTRVIPGHDARLLSSVPLGQQQDVPLEIRFSRNMSCDSVTNSLRIDSRTQDSTTPQLDRSTVTCSSQDTDIPEYNGEVATAWIWKGTLTNISHGVHAYTIQNATTADGSGYTNAADRFIFRLGAANNPMVFPMSSNYTTNMLQKDTVSGTLTAKALAAGADLYQYSTNWGMTYSPWMAYTGEPIDITEQDWHGTDAQRWEGTHVILKYWSETTGSADHIQHTDLTETLPRRWPHAFVEGSWNQWGYDAGTKNQMEQLNKDGGQWTYDLAAEWPTQITINIWGMDAEGKPDLTAAYGDVDGDHVLDWLPPNSASDNVINLTQTPPTPYIAWRIVVNDGNYSYGTVPMGSAWSQLVVGLLLGLVPLATAFIGVWAFRRSYYHVLFNEVGFAEKKGYLPRFKLPLTVLEALTPTLSAASSTKASRRASHASLHAAVAQAINLHPHQQNANGGVARAKSRAFSIAADTGSLFRRSTLIATMEYEIADWNIKVKIGGLGVMASLMGKSLSHQDLIWIVPCIGDIDYPLDTPAEPVMVKVLDNVYRIAVQYHRVRNITYVLLDAPVFRQQTKAEPYPARMDDLDSAIYYSAWNACIAEMIRRFHPNLYHINDYHGALAPLYLLPNTIPVSLSLHNAEFQGLWPLRTRKEMKEVSETFNLDEKVIKRYVQFGEVFNMLHAGASYLRVHQNGFGAVGVSKKYGGRSWARYPIFWGLSKIGSLPNPDPSDTMPWSRSTAAAKEAPIDESQESQRGSLRSQAQEWAGLKVDPEADLFVFVGRWSMQKGVDLIADVFFEVLEQYPKTQLICVGPVIDLYGKFAALKLEKMMEKYPDRVFSKPEFTMLPPYIFSGAEFALIPSRDEPFGLVAVEFGRKGALGVGAKVGGLGQMPGWWYTIESASTGHLLQQFKTAITASLASSQKVRAQMRAWSALQRFPVAQWVEDLETLQTQSIEKHLIVQKRGSRHSWPGYHWLRTKTSRSNSFNELSEKSADTSQITTERNSLSQDHDSSVLFSEVSFSQPGGKRRRWHHSSSRRHSVASTGSDLPSTKTHSIHSNNNDYAQSHRSASISSQDQDPLNISHRTSMESDHPDPMAERRASVVSRIHRKMSTILGGDATHTQKYVHDVEDAHHSEKTNPAPEQQGEMVAVRDFASQAATGSGRDRKASQFGAHFHPEVQSDEIGFVDFTNEPMSDIESDSEEDSDGDSNEISSDTGYSSVDESLNTEDNHEDHTRSVTGSVSNDHENTPDTAHPQPKRSTVTEEGGKPVGGPDSTTIKMPEDREVSQLDPKAVSAMPGSDVTTEPTRKRQLSFALPEIQHSGNPGSGQGRRRFDKRLSLRQIRGAEEETAFSLQRVIPSFTDRKGSYAHKFGDLLDQVDAKSSVDKLCIENYLKNSEKQFFGKYARAKLGTPHHAPPQPQAEVPLMPSSFAGVDQGARRPTVHRIDAPESTSSTSSSERHPDSYLESSSAVMAGGRRDTVFNLGNDYVAPKGIHKIFQKNIVGDWQGYAILLAIGQILSANSYQITLLQGQLGQSDVRAYAIGSIYLVASIGWWMVFRFFESRYVLSLPWFFYGLAFFLIGMGPYANYLDGTRGWLFSCASGFYAIAAASGSLFFSLNFGTEGGTPVSTWILRASIIQGIQQLYVTGLWKAGSSLDRTSRDGTGNPASGLLTSNSTLTAITVPIAIILWAAGILLFICLPSYYRQRPGAIPSFYRALLRRKVVLWFFVTVCLQNYFLSTVYGRNWQYLFSSQHAPSWAVGLLLLLFFVGVWGFILYLLYIISKEHSWVPPILGVCLGAPRWCQELWAVSGIAAYVPWGGATCGALLGRTLWLWLGVLDEVQGIGLGMLLLQTLPRFHVAGTLVACQIIGSAANIVARASSPDRTGPGDVFPNFAINPDWGLTRAWFWIALICQMIICLGFLKFFRKEQLFKP